MVCGNWMRVSDPRFVAKEELGGSEYGNECDSKMRSMVLAGVIESVKVDFDRRCCRRILGGYPP